MLPNDYARCAGVGDDINGWREGCENCARRSSTPTGIMVGAIAPPAIISSWCEFWIGPSPPQPPHHVVNVENHEQRDEQ